ncbi:33363_t:CDS:2, partial [Gigaspora margarita]
SETIIDINSTFTLLESNKLNTKTLQTSIEVAITTSLSNISFSSTSTPTESSKITIEFGGEIHYISISTIDIEQEQTITFYSTKPYTNSGFKICTFYFTSPEISLLTSTADYWSSIAVNHNTEQSSSGSYTPLYLQLDTNNYNTKTQYTSIYPDITDPEETTQTPINNQSDSDSEQFFGKAFTAIFDQVQTLNNNTNN